MLAGQRGVMFLEQHDGKWATILRPKAPGSQPRVYAEGVDLALAMGVAEEKIRQALAKDGGTPRLFIDKSAPWRRQPISPGQKQALTRMGIPYREGMTKGEASDLMDAKKAARLVGRR
jgi:hypothetical protein